MARKDDRRILRTRKQLRESILSLILEKGYDDISIQDVTDRANLGRATFYLHYREKDDLLVDLIRQFTEEFVAMVPQFSADSEKIHDKQSVQRLFEYVESHYDVYRILLIGKGYVVATHELHQILRRAVSKNLAENMKTAEKPLNVPREFVENYQAGALLALLYWWLENDMPYVPADMAVMYQHLNWLDPKNFDHLVGDPILPPNLKKRKRPFAPEDFLPLVDEDDEDSSDEDGGNGGAAQEAKPARAVKASPAAVKKDR